MPDIKKLKSHEMQEIIDFYYHIEDYGHIFHKDPKELNSPFIKILEGIQEVKKLMDESYSA